ncbi:MAG: molybdenum cofactor guanylyltransferase MobA [Beijerinckiaceae bacterium]|nr:molybdenum cofactor guanylyltransferase MobA [Beijerinckiaceae bacterium]
MTQTLGIILAGGLSTRMGGGNKGLRLLAGKRLIDHVADRLRPQCAGLALNANDDAEFDGTLLPDETPGLPGPLAGVEAGLAWASIKGCGWLVSAPADCPFLPRDLVERLQARQGATGASCVVASSGRSDHPTVALWHVGLLDDLRRALRDEGLRRVRFFLERHGAARAEWDAAPVDPFLNVNTAADLEAAEDLLPLLR